jgi:hypothetical protein
MPVCPRVRRVPRIVALSGLGVAGKTSVALECAYRRLASTGLVWQFAAEDPAAMAAGFAQLAALLGGPDVTGGTPVRALAHWSTVSEGQAMTSWPTGRFCPVQVSEARP